MEKKIFVVLIAGILFAVFGFSILHKGNSKELSGVYTKYDKPEFSLEGYQSGEYQTQMDNYYSANYSAHNLAVRIYNQVRYTAFGISDSVVVGRDGYLFEEGYINESLGVDGFRLLTDDEIQNIAEKVLAVQIEAIAQGKGFVFVFTPSKTDYERENIPAYCYNKVPNYSEDERNYVRLKRAFDEIGVVYIDANDFLTEENVGAPIFYKTGIHWTRTSAVYTMNEITEWLNTTYGYDIETIEVTDMQTSSETDDLQDQDLYRLLNVYSAKKDDLYYLPIERTSGQSANAPSVLIQGGSFTNKLADIASQDALFSTVWQEFYALCLNNYTTGESVNTEDLNNEAFSEAVNQADIIILETNVENVAGLMPEMYDSIYQHLSEQK